MALKRFRPVTPGLRKKIAIKKSYPKVKKIRSLIVANSGPVARSKGTVSMRHRSAGVKKMYRIVDFKRDKYNVKARVSRVDYDPNRGCSLALLNYIDGEKRYILRPGSLKVGDFVVSSKSSVEIKAGNSTSLSNLPLGTSIHNIEIYPGKGGQIVRGAGNFATIMAKEGSWASVKLPSGEIKKISALCFATIGVLDNEDIKNISFGKAGIKKYIGRRSKVRGVAYGNPRKHPHGGSYKTSGVGRKSPVSPWGQPAKGYKTRRRTHTDKYIVSKRKK